MEMTGKATGKKTFGVKVQRVNLNQVNLHAHASIPYSRGTENTSAPWTTTQLIHSPGMSWDEWYEQAYELCPQAEMAVEQVANLVSNFTLVPTEGDEASVQLLADLVDRKDIVLSEVIRNGVWSYLTYGRVFIEPVWTEAGDDLERIKLPDPKTITILRDNAADIAKLREASPESAQKFQPEGKGVIIGHLQKVSGESKSIYFPPDHMIFLPRSTPKYPNGLSVLHNHYRRILYIAGKEEALARTGRIFSNPPWHFRIGNQNTPCPANATGQAMIDFVKDQLGETVEAGNVENITQLFLPDWVEFVIPKFDIPITTEMIARLEREEDQLLLGIGVPPAILSAQGFRATAQEALRFLEDRITPIRDLFYRNIADSILRPYLELKHGSKSEGTKWHMPKWIWADITPGDMDGVRDSLSRAYQSRWLSANEARKIHGGLTPWSEDQLYSEPRLGIESEGGVVNREKQLEGKYGRPIKELVTEMMGAKEDGGKRMSHRQTARELSISPTTLQNWRQKWGLWP